MRVTKCIEYIRLRNVYRWRSDSEKRLRPDQRGDVEVSLPIIRKVVIVQILTRGLSERGLFKKGT